MWWHACNFDSCFLISDDGFIYVSNKEKEKWKTRHRNHRMQFQRIKCLPIIVIESKTKAIALYKCWLRSSYYKYIHIYEVYSIKYKKKKNDRMIAMQWHGLLLYILFYKIILSLTIMLYFEHVYFVVIFLPGIDDSPFECEMKYFTRCLVAIEMQNKNPCNNSNFFSFKWFFFSVEMANEKKNTHNIHLNVMRIVITLAVWVVSCRKIAIKKTLLLLFIIWELNTG